jgi:Response regulator containing a CheY-like receiver domain and an HTH DNA-binding domain
MNHTILMVGCDQATQALWQDALKGVHKILVSEILPDEVTLQDHPSALFILDTRIIDADDRVIGRFIENGYKVLVLGEDWPEKKQIGVYAQGASGYCNKEVQPTLAQKAVETIMHGDVWIHLDLISKVISTLVQRDRPSQRESKPDNRLQEVLSVLSAREKEVVEWIRKGESNKQIAERLFISERTVKAHLGSIFKKLKLSDRLQLVIYLQQYVD